MFYRKIIKIGSYPGDLDNGNRDWEIRSVSGRLPDNPGELDWYTVRTTSGGCCGEVASVGKLCISGQQGKNRCIDCIIKF